MISLVVIVCERPACQSKMADETKFPRLIFEFPFDDAAAYDAEAHRYLSHVSVELASGRRVPVLFDESRITALDRSEPIGRG